MIQTVQTLESLVLNSSHTLQDFVLLPLDGKAVSLEPRSQSSFLWTHILWASSRCHLSSGNSIWLSGTELAHAGLCHGNFGQSFHWIPRARESKNSRRLCALGSRWSLPTPGEGCERKSEIPSFMVVAITWMELKGEPGFLPEWVSSARPTTPDKGAPCVPASLETGQSTWKMQQKVGESPACGQASKKGSRISLEVTVL